MNTSKPECDMIGTEREVRQRRIRTASPYAYAVSRGFQDFQVLILAFWFEVLGRWHPTVRPTRAALSFRAETGFGAGGDDKLAVAAAQCCFLTVSLRTRSPQRIIFDPCKHPFAQTCTCLDLRAARDRHPKSASDVRLPGLRRSRERVFERKHRDPLGKDP